MKGTYESIQEESDSLLSSEIINRRWNREIAEQILHNWQSSGLSLPVFSKQMGIGYQRLLSWRRILSEQGTKEFVRISVNHRVTGDIEITLCCGRLLRFASGTDPRYVKSLVRAIEK